MKSGTKRKCILILVKFNLEKHLKLALTFGVTILLIVFCKAKKDTTHSKVVDSTVVSTSTFKANNSAAYAHDTSSDEHNGAWFPDSAVEVNHADLSNMIEYYFEQNPVCAFGGKTKSGSIEINGVDFQSFVTGPSQLIEGFHNGCDDLPGISDIFSWAMNKTNTNTDLKQRNFTSIIREYSGVTPFKSSKDFWHVRPQIIEWGLKNLIPAPDCVISNVTCQNIYNTLFYELTSRLYQSLLWLESVDGRVEQEFKKYRDTCTANNLKELYFGVYYLKERYKNIKFYDVSDNTYFDEAVAIGFWLRRYWDGSYEAVKKSLITFLEKYDPELLGNMYIKSYLSRLSIDTSAKAVTELLLTYPGLIIELPHFNYTCEDSKNDWNTSDTIVMDIRELEYCTEGKLDTIRIFSKFSNIKIRVHMQSAKTFYFHDEGKGGMWSESKISTIYSEKLTLPSVGDNEFNFKDISKASEIQWEKFTRYDSLVIDSILTTIQGRDTMLLPAADIITINSLENDGKIIFHKAIRLNYGYGD